MGFREDPQEKSEWTGRFKNALKTIKENRMNEQFRPVGIGLILGLLGLMFGIFWAMYLVVNHENIHKELSEGGKAALMERFVINSSSPEGHGVHVHSSPVHEPKMEETQPQSHDHGNHDHEAMTAPQAEGHDHGSHDHASTPAPAPARENATEPHDHAGHDDPLMEAAHERLTRGHLHAMGLGTITIVLSALLGFLSAPARVKTFASACLGIGGIFYPLAWIVMGYRTMEMGLTASQESVMPLVGPSVGLVLLGIFMTFFYVLSTVFRGK